MDPHAGVAGLIQHAICMHAALTTAAPHASPKFSRPPPPNTHHPTPQAKFDLMPEEWLMDQLVAACLKQQQHHHQQLQQQQQAPPAAAPSSSSSSPASPQQQQPAAAARAAAGEDAAAVLTCLARYSSAYSYRLPEGWLASFLAALQPGLRGFRPEALVSIVHSVVCLNHMPARPFMVSLYGALKERLAADPRLAPSDYSRLLWSLSRVDFRPPRSWLAAFMEASAPLLPQLRPRALAEAVWALAVWDAKPTPRWLEVRVCFRALGVRATTSRRSGVCVYGWPRHWWRGHARQAAQAEGSTHHSSTCACPGCVPAEAICPPWLCVYVCWQSHQPTSPPPPSECLPHGPAPNCPRPSPLPRALALRPPPPAL